MLDFTDFTQELSHLIFFLTHLSQLGQDFIKHYDQIKFVHKESRVKAEAAWADVNDQPDVEDHDVEDHVRLPIPHFRGFI